MTHSFATVVFPFPSANAERVNAYLNDIGNPAGPAIKGPLDKSQFVHFMSLTVVPDENESHLVLEVSGDGEVDGVLDRLAVTLAVPLDRVFRLTGAWHGETDLGAFLRGRHIGVGQGWFSTPGLNFDGTPGMSVSRIRDEEKLAKWASRFLEKTPISVSALDTLEAARKELWDHKAMKWAFVAEDAPCLDGVPDAIRGILPTIWTGLTDLAWPFVLIALAGAALVTWQWGLALGVFAFALLAAVQFGVLYVWLRIKETTDVPEDIQPSAAHVECIMTRENFAAQNHMASVSTLKPGQFRRFLLRVGMWAAGQSGAHFSRPGFLGPTGVIHFARWFVIPKTDKLIFFSNYDGAWESYLEDFIEEAYQGVSGIWSNTVGFPKTDNLFGVTILGIGTHRGANDGDRLRRWTRRQQYVSRVWYSAYTDVTLDRIRTNAAIRQGIAVAKTEADAADWLSCFGSTPRPASTLESNEIPTLVFGGLSRLRFSACLMLRLADAAEANKAWLKTIEGQLTYGNGLRAKDSALVVAFSSQGLLNIGLTGEALATFPVAFQHGAAAPWRSRALSDIGCNAPEHWWWGGRENPVEAALIVYADKKEQLDHLVRTQANTLEKIGLRIVHLVTMKEIPDTPPGSDIFPREPFGFSDGISQPLIKGTKRALAVKVQHQVVGPGEIILGYPDNQGYMPPTPSVPAAADPLDLLPAAPAVGADLLAQRPDFAEPAPTGAHDLGRNGSFLVIRQLEQDVEGFCGFIHKAADQLQHDPRAPALPITELRQWLKAKMVGRWPDGTSLVRHKEPPEKPHPDNEFLYGKEDPTGLRCPLGAHTRRANPRESFAPDSEIQLKITNRHRILRVGRSYCNQPEKSDKPGLLFMCLNTDIERQFEFIQQTWVLNPRFHGLQDEADPMLAGKTSEVRMTIPTPNGPLPVKGLEDFVTVRGGGYFFMPGRTCIRYLAH